MLALKTTDKLILATTALAVAAGVWLLRTFDPNAAGNFFPKCIFLSVTGFHCVGCGLTRALHALAHGDIVRALEMNVVAVLLLPLIPLILLHDRGLTPRWMQGPMSIFAAPKFWLVLLPGYWIVRNLPWWPFTWLAPG